MSSASIHHQGYTPPQFLEKICRGTSLSSHHSFYQPSSAYHIHSSTNIFPSSNNTLYSSYQSIPTPAMPPKLTRTHSLADEQKISTTKFRLFFKTIADSIFQQEDINVMWTRFENSLNNPFQFDRFIEDMRRKSQNKKQQKQSIPLILSEIEAEPIKIKSKSLPKNDICVSQQRRNKSLGKKCYGEEDSKFLMKKQIKYLSRVIMHGEKFIRQK